MKHFFLPVLCILLFVSSGLARQDSLVEAAEEDIDNIFRKFDRPQTPGCAAGVNIGGRLVFAKGYGTANLDYGIGITPESRFMIASVSKQFSAAALLMLEQQGRLDLDADLRPLVPAISQFETAITARQLIHHTSGIRDIYSLLSVADIGLDDTTTPEQALDILSRQQKLNFPPGTRHLYSNMAYFLMSEIVYIFSGKRLGDYTREHFFEPSGMHATHWHDDTERIVPNRVISYRPSEDGPGMFYRGNMARVGARGLFTTVEDFSKWDANFVENRTDLNSFPEKMVRPGFTAEADSINYGSGLRLGRYKSLYTVGHGGNYMGFRSHYIRFPAYQLGVFVFCNMSNIQPSQYTEAVADLYLRDVFNNRFEAYTGLYSNAGYDTRFNVKTKNGDLYLHRRGEETRKLEWIDADHFRSGKLEIRFQRDSAQTILSMTLQAPRTGRVTFARENFNK